MIVELTRQEALKLFSQRYPWVLIVLVLAVQAVYTLVTATRPARTSLEVLTAPQLWAQGATWGLRFAVYVVLVFGAMALSREFSLGTVKTVLVLPVRRYQWLAAKLLGLVLLSWALLLAIVVLGVVLVAVQPGWGDVVRSDVTLYTLGEVWGHMALATGLTAVALLPVCAFALLVSAHFTSSGAAVGVALLLGIVLETATEMVDVGRWVFLHHLHRPFAQMVKLGKGLPFQWEAAWAWGLPVSLVSFAVLSGWLLWRIERRDITE